MTALYINEHIGIYEIHPLWSRPPLRLLPKDTGVR